MNQNQFVHCIKCTICVENCPVHQVNPDYPGPKQAGPDAARFRLDGGGQVDSWIQHCTQCGRCAAACPYDVEPSRLIRDEQQRYADSHGRGLPGKLFARNYYLGRLATVFAPVANFITGLPPVRWLFGKVGFSRYIPFPRFRFKTLQLDKGPTDGRPGSGSTWEEQVDKRLAGDVKIDSSRERKRAGTRRVAFFHGCYMNNNDPDVGRRIIAILRALGIEVTVPEQTCCGLAALGNADLKTARQFARRNGRIFGELIDDGYEVLYSCTSCGHTLIHDYPGQLDAPRGLDISGHAWNLYEYLLPLIDELAPRLGPVNKKIAYHVPCHLKTASMGYPAAEILKRIPELDLTVMDEHCCGMSGSYGFKAKNEATAKQLGMRAAEHLLSIAPDAMISDCGACRMQLGHLSGLEAVDPINILAESLGVQV